MPYVTSSGVEIYFESSGDGLPVILHTGGGGDGRMWELAGYVAGLSPEFRCIVMDHRGHGRSGRPVDLAQHSISQYTDDILAVMDAAEALRAAYWGYSAGNPMGFDLAARYPDRTAGIILLGGLIECDYDDPSQEYHQEWANDVREHGVGYFVDGMREHDGMDFPEWFMEQMESTDREMFALQVEGARQWHGPWSIFSQVSCPVLSIAGELEDPEGDNAKVVKELSDARSVLIPGLGHVGAFVRSDLTLAQALPFLRTLKN